MYSAQLGRQQLVWVGTWAVNSGQKGKESHENAFGRFGQMSRPGYSRMPSLLDSWTGTLPVAACGQTYSET